MSRHHPSTVGRCDRWLPVQSRECRKPGRFLVYGSMVLCKQCHQRFAAGKDTLFDPGPAPTSRELWDLQQRTAS